MEQERPIVDEREEDLFNDLSHLFEKTVLYTINYQRRLSVLSTLFDNTTKVRDLIKDKSKD